jgi:hypothetical protein
MKDREKQPYGMITFSYVNRLHGAQKSPGKLAGAFHVFRNPVSRERRFYGNTCSCTGDPSYGSRGHPTGDSNTDEADNTAGPSTDPGDNSTEDPTRDDSAANDGVPNDDPIGGPNGHRSGRSLHIRSERQLSWLQLAAVW